MTCEECEKDWTKCGSCPVMMKQVADERRKQMDNKVDHPSHYNREGAKECIEEMEMIFGRRAVSTFCLLNAWKYRYRAADKNGEEDLKKSDWYLAKYEELGGGNNPI